MVKLDEQALNAPIVGLRLTGTTLAEELGAQPATLVFLRHLGCVFCGELIRDLREATTLEPRLPRTLFVFHGQPDEATPLFDRLWPGATAIADADRRLYAAFGLQRATLSQAFGPPVWVCGLRAALKGAGVRGPKGDRWVMPGLFLVHGSQVLWQHDFRHIGDHPAPGQLATQVLGCLPELALGVR